MAVHSFISATSTLASLTKRARFLSLGQKPFKHALLMLGCLLVVGMFVTPGQAATDTTGIGQRIATLEQSLFSVSYGNDQTESRVGRLETVVFGETKADLPLNQRLSDLEQVITQAPQPLPDSVFEPVPEIVTTPATSTQSTPVTHSTASNQTSEDFYPAVTQMEKQALGADYKSDDLSIRVDRLEKKVFGQTNPSAPLIERVDRLASRIKPQMPVAHSPYPQEDSMARSGAQADSQAPDWMQSNPGNSNSGHQSDDDLASGPDENGNFPPSNDFYTSLTAAEKKLLKSTYHNEPTETRLSRLETHVFHQSASNTIPPQERLNRVIAVADGGGNKVETVEMNKVKRYLPMVLMLLPLLL